MIQLAPDNLAIIDDTQSLCLSIAGIRVALTSEDPTLRLAVEGAARLFRVDDDFADLSVRAGWGDLKDEVGGELIFDSGALWQLFREGDGYLWRFRSPYFGATPYKVARFNHQLTEGEVLLHRPYFVSHETVNPLEYPLDELLILNLLARGRGAELHSCGILDESGRGYLFLGQSGAGKTTMARLWQGLRGVEILSDDRIIARREGDVIRMHGTPWHGEGELSSAGAAPLTRIFFLKQGARNEAVALDRTEAAARLFSCSFPTFYDPDGLAFTLAFFDELTTMVECFELTFVPDESVVEFVRGG